MIQRTLIILILLCISVRAEAQVDFLLVRDGFGNAGEATTQSLELVLENSQELRGLQFDLEFDPALFSVAALTGVNRFAALDVLSNEAESGRFTVLVTDLGGAAITPGSAPVIRVDGSVAEGIEPQAIPIRVRNILFSNTLGQALLGADVTGYVFVAGGNYVRLNSGHQQTQGDTIAVDLYNGVDLGGAQFTVRFRPEFLRLHSFSVGSRSEAMDLQTNEVAPGEIIVLLSSTERNTIAAGTGPVFQFVADTVETAFLTPSSPQKLTLSEVVLSDVTGTALAHEAFDGEFFLDIPMLPVSVAESNVPEGFSLSQNYPNPFNPSTTISFAVPTAGEVTLSIYNIRSQLVRTLVSGSLVAGRHQVVWKGLDARGLQVASGIYVSRLAADNFVAYKKLVLTK